jgi:hypothetical protein
MSLAKTLLVAGALAAAALSSPPAAAGRAGGANCALPSRAGSAVIARTFAGVIP